MSILAHVSVGHLGISGIGWAWLQAAGQVQVLSMSLSSSLDRIATAYFSHGKHTFNCYYIISTDNNYLMQVTWPRSKPNCGKVHTAQQEASQVAHPNPT